MTDYNHTSLPAVSEDDKHWAAATHWGGMVLAFFTSWMVGAGGFVVPLVIQIVKGKDSPFVAQHARESMNFNLSMFIYAVIGVIIALILVGGTLLTLGLGVVLTLPSAFVLALAYLGLAIVWVVCSIIGTLRAYEGKPYHYPLTIRLIR